MAGEDEFVKRRIYLTLERGRDIALRNLLRKVFLAGGFEESKEPNTAPVRKTRIRTAEFGAAISMGNKEIMDDDEVECLLANMIYKVPSSLVIYSVMFYRRNRHLLPSSALPLIVLATLLLAGRFRVGGQGDLPYFRDSRIKLMVCMAELNEGIHSAGARDDSAE